MLIWRGSIKLVGLRGSLRGGPDGVALVNRNAILRNPTPFSNGMRRAFVRGSLIGLESGPWRIRRPYFFEV